MADRPVACIHCGAQLKQPKVGRVRFYCNTKCRDKARRERDLPKRLEIERRAGAKRRVKQGYRALSSQSERERKFKAYIASDTTRVCEICGIEFCNLFGRHSWMTVCSSACARDKQLRKRIRNEKVRRHRKRGIRCEVVDPFKVFERDNWTCQLCGHKTPAKLRGSYDNRAPECDHILPLSKGGEHTYANTQCACRQCNRLKWNEPKGQLQFFASPSQ